MIHYDPALEDDQPKPEPDLDDEFEYQDYSDSYSYSDHGPKHYIPPYEP